MSGKTETQWNERFGEAWRDIGLAGGLLQGGTPMMLVLSAMRARSHTVWLLESIIERMLHAFHRSPDCTWHWRPRRIEYAEQLAQSITAESKGGAQIDVRIPRGG